VESSRPRHATSFQSLRGLVLTVTRVAIYGCVSLADVIRYAVTGTPWCLSAVAFYRRLLSHCHRFGTRGFSV
jgi:hypothetical protein